MRPAAVSILIVVIWTCDALSQTPDEARAILEKLTPGQSAQIGPVKFTMNQKQAGTPDKDGWYPARSTRGGFTVRMPAPYNDFTTVTQAKDGATIITDAVGGRSAEGARFLVNCLRRSDGKVEPDWAASIAESLATGEPSAQRQPVQRTGVAGVELRIRSTSRGLFLALFLSGHGSMCQVSVEYSGTDGTVVEDAARVFLDSFTLAAAR